MLHSVAYLIVIDVGSILVYFVLHLRLDVRLLTALCSLMRFWNFIYVLRRHCFQFYYSLTLFIAKVTVTNDGGRVLDASVHLLSRALLSHSASDSWCIKYLVASNVKQTPLVYICLSVRHLPSFVSVSCNRHRVFSVYKVKLVDYAMRILAGQVG
jgi:CDP-diglyceride synthetase